MLAYLIVSLVKEIQATKAEFLGSICQYSNIDEKGRGEGGMVE